MATSSEPRRLRWSVPTADTSTNEWLDLQYNISQSLQLLIRESIQRDGYIDVVNRPVEQLPRRGRPPVGAEDQSSTAQKNRGQRQSDDDRGEGRDEDSESGSHTVRSHIDDTRGLDVSDADAAPPEVDESSDERNNSNDGDAADAAPMDMESIFGDRR